MKTTEFVKLEKRLLQHLSPSFVIKGKLCFLAPIDKTLSGFYFEPSAFNEKSFYVTQFFLPLCVPVERLHLTFGHRVGSAKRWHMDGLDVAELAAYMDRGTNALAELRTPKDVAKSLRSFAGQSNPHIQEALAYVLLQAEEVEKASDIIDKLLGSMSQTVPWQEVVLRRLEMIQSQLSLSLAQVKRQLAAWELESVNNLKLLPFYRSHD